MHSVTHNAVFRKFSRQVTSTDLNFVYPGGDQSLPTQGAINLCALSKAAGKSCRAFGCVLRERCGRSDFFIPPPLPTRHAPTSTLYYWTTAVVKTGFLLSYMFKPLYIFIILL